MNRSHLPTVSVLGAGLMGAGIAHVFLSAGAAVTLWDPDETALASAPGRIEQHLARRGRVAPVQRIRLGGSLAAAVDGADVVFEAAPEQMAIKQRLVQEVQTLSPDVIIASNTSVLRITEIARAASAPERIIGAHWWNPPYLIPIVEVVRGEATSPATARQLHDWLVSAGKSPVSVAKDTPGFVGNRMQFALWREAAAIVEEGICSPEVVDLVARMTFGRRLAAMGPLENADFIGLELVCSIMDYLSPHLSTAQTTPDLFRRPREEGHLGSRAGRGVFDWPPGARDSAERRLHEHLARFLPDTDTIHDDAHR